MVQDINRTRSASFPETAPTAYPVFFRTYSRSVNGRRESWQDVCDRTLRGLVQLGKLLPEEEQLIREQQEQLKCLTSGRWLWVGGTPWSQKPENFNGAYNCTSTNVVDWRAFGLMMDLAMQGCGTGAVLEPKYINQLPAIRNRLDIEVTGVIGQTPPSQRLELTTVAISGNQVSIKVGDSRQGWVTSYQTLLELASDPHFNTAEPVKVTVDISDVRPSGEALKGFGGMANPVKLPKLYERVAAILNKAVGRQLTSVECCLLIDEAAVCIVAGNIRRSAGMRQFASDDMAGATAKDNLWQMDQDGNWRIDPERDALRMANHTRVFHRKPTEQECIEAVRKQYYSGEGAIQWAGEAIARANADVVTSELKSEFIRIYAAGKGKDWLRDKLPHASDRELAHRMSRYGLNPCVTADTWVHTEAGARQIKDLIAKQQSLYINGELFSTTPAGFFFSGIKPVYRLATKEGFVIRLTGNHRLLKVTAQTQKKQYTAWVECEQLQLGDRVILHDHRGLSPWYSHGTFAEGWLLGNLIGDGCLSGQKAILRYWGSQKLNLRDHALEMLSQVAAQAKVNSFYHQQNDYYEVTGTILNSLAEQYGIAQGNKHITNGIEQASYEFYRGFLRGIFDADGSVQGGQQKGVSVRLSQPNLSNLQAVQRMLARLGIISTIHPERRPQALPNSQRQPSLYCCKADHELVISEDNLAIFQAVVGFQSRDKAEKLDQLLQNYQRHLNRERFAVTITAIQFDGIEPVYDCTVPGVACFDANGFVAHNCGEILMSDNHCNLAEVHLNMLDPHDFEAQRKAFTAGALSVSALLHHRFTEERYRYSREIDPIVGVSFTGLFDFFVHAFGVEWLQWWAEGRPDSIAGLQFKLKEQEYLSSWKEIVNQVVWEYCDRHKLTRPNRCTTVQPAGTKSLLTGASPGWHPPKAQRFIRRITFRKNDPVALACLDYGYSVIPSQSDKDEQGNLLNDPFDPRCTEWLVELPVSVSWADLPNVEEVDVSQFSALAQFDFYMQVQKFYTTHNTSATIELREQEIEPLARRIYQAVRDDEGYISAALLARFDDLQTFPRLPFEPISKERYLAELQAVRARRKSNDFYQSLIAYDLGLREEAGPAGCDSDKCMLPESMPCIL
jgi:ribonucleotide reductase class II